MKILLVTVAGKSSRFSRSLGRTCLKCIYHPGNISESLLYRLLHLDMDFDKYIIVGGFMYEQLKLAMEEHFSDISGKVILVNNEKYGEYGSGYSLYRGFQEAAGWDFSEILFAEGDLFVDRGTFLEISRSEKDIITCNKEMISAEKSVVFYFDKEYKVHYVYDASHNMLNITEPFRSIHNSGQVWKFRRPGLLRDIYGNMREQEWQGTNLVFIQKYFQSLMPEEYDIVRFKRWVNCNTIADFEEARNG